MSQHKTLDTTFADSCVALCIEKYNSLPKTGKPTDSEWTVVAAVVEDNGEDLCIVALGTGSKCIGRNSMCPRGTIVNDAHAEVLARRGFLIYLYNEILSWKRNKSSRIFCDVISGKMKMKANVRYCFVTSTIPCGDAAIIPVTSEMAVDKKSEFIGPPAKKRKLVTPVVGDIYRTGAKCLPSSDKQDPKLPGVEYHTVGLSRTKPGRGDPTASMSCSDKLARWNAVGVQGALLSLLISDPIFFSCLIIGGGVPFSIASIERAINTRIEKPGKLIILSSSLPFPLSPSSVRQRPAPSSITWNFADKSTQVCVNGRLLGATKKTDIFQSSLRVSKVKIMKLFYDTVSAYSEIFPYVDKLNHMTYAQLKDLAKDYKNNWNAFVENNFKVWTKKDRKLEEFKLS